jgi:hypothetical protein
MTGGGEPRSCKCSELSLEIIRDLLKRGAEIPAGMATQRRERRRAPVQAELLTSAKPPRSCAWIAYYAKH